MTEKSDDEKYEELKGLSLEEVLRFQTEKTGKLLDYNQRIVHACRVQGLNWREIAKAFATCAEEAMEISETCFIAARVAADRAGDLISAEFNLVPLDEDEDDDSDDDDDS